jgi:hypothetical protein
MGQVIERIAQERGYEIVLKKTRNNTFEGLLSLTPLILVFQRLQ